MADTSVLIEYLRGSQNEAVEKFEYILGVRIAFGVNSFIYQELLQGVKTEKEFKTLKQYLDTQKFYYLKHERESFAQLR